MFGKGLLTGMSVTWKHLWGKKETFCYPEEKLPMTDNFRGGNLAMDWRVCIGCSMCANACPNKALDLTIVQDAKKKRHMKSGTMPLLQSLRGGLPRQDPRLGQGLCDFDVEQGDDDPRRNDGQGSRGSGGIPRAGRS